MRLRKAKRRTATEWSGRPGVSATRGVEPFQHRSGKRPLTHQHDDKGDSAAWVGKDGLDLLGVGFEPLIEPLEPLLVDRGKPVPERASIVDAEARGSPIFPFALDQEQVKTVVGKSDRIKV
ncbi:hypothetical protein ACIBQX_48350 [Nonomuraea sp. NPDC049714]|uniref:hypothetical protein n=1 Tax=Nonomuraea sp. NPDC049714 TaxID=3364357 RepID=UPI0037AA6CCE